MSDGTAVSEPPKAFVISPIGKPGTEIHQKASYFLDYLVRRALPQPEWHVHRADEGNSPDSIGQHVVRSIHEADLVIADLSGHNPNVFYELAIAHGWRKPVVHFITEGETIPFDIHDMRTIHYDITDLRSVDAATRKLQEYAQHAMENVEELITPLSAFSQFAVIRSDVEDGGSAVADALEQVMARLSTIERHIARRSDRYVSGNLPTITNAERATVESALSHMFGETVLDTLTARELEIASLAVSGLSNKQIAEQLFVSARTIEGYLYQLFAKLGIKDRSGLPALEG